MRLGGYEIEGPSRKTWVILGIVAMLIVGYFYTNSLKPAPPDPIATPYYDPASLGKLAKSDKWFQDQVRASGIERLKALSPITDGYVDNIGKPLRFIAYVPPDNLAKDSRPSLYVQRGGWTFIPAVLLDPRRSYALDELSDQASSELNNQPLLLGFPSSEAPGGGDGGRVYEFTGLLWWNSSAFSPPEGDELEAEYRSSPVILVPPGNAPRSIGPIELAAPTTHRADLDIETEGGNASLKVSRLEWSAGNQGGLRACVTYTNLGQSKALSPWLGFNESQVQLAPGAPIFTSDSSSDPSLGAGVTEIPPHASISGYITFPEALPSAAPSDTLVLTMPSPDPISGNIPGSGDTLTISVSPQQWTDVTTARAYDNSRATAGCGGSAAGDSQSGSGSGASDSGLIPPSIQAEP